MNTTANTSSYIPTEEEMALTATNEEFEEIRADYVGILQNMRRVLEKG